MLSRRGFLHFASGITGLSQEPESGLRFLPPPAPGIEDPTLARFLEELVSIVAFRDHKRLEALMLPTFRVDFDTGKGPNEFHKYWLPKSRESSVWEILSRILQLGGTAYSKTLYGAPYVFTRFPFDLDPLAYVVATGADIPLRSDSTEQAEPVRAVSHAILPLARPLTPPVRLPAAGFLEVRVPDDPPSYVAMNQVYSPAGYRIFLEKQNGRWRWISLACATLAYPPDLQRIEEKLGGPQR